MLLISSEYFYLIFILFKISFLIKLHRTRKEFSGNMMSRTKIPINTYYDSNFKFLNHSDGSQDINVEDIDGGAKKTERRSIKLKSNANIN